MENLKKALTMLKVKKEGVLLRKAGFDVRLAFDINAAAIETYNRGYPGGRYHLHVL